MKLIVDAGPIIALAKVDRLTVLEALFDEIWLPSVVVHEDRVVPLLLDARERGYWLDDALIETAHRLTGE